MAKKAVKKAVKKERNVKKIIKKEAKVVKEKKVAPKKAKKVTLGEATKKWNKEVEKAAAANDPSLVKTKGPNPYFKKTWKSEADPKTLLEEAKKRDLKEETLNILLEKAQKIEAGGDMNDEDRDIVAMLKKKAPKDKSAVSRNLEEIARSGIRVQRAGSPVPIVSKGFIGDSDLQNFKSMVGDDEKEAFIKAACAVVDYYKNTMKEKNELVRLLNEEVGVLKKKNILLEAKVNRAESTIEGQLDLSKFKDKV